MASRILLVLIIATATQWDTPVATATPLIPRTARSLATLSHLEASLDLRGGAASSKPSSKKKKRKKKAKTAIAASLKEADAAQALGDAIRDRADVLRKDPILQSIDWSIDSLGQALGVSDEYRRTVVQQQQTDGGGVPASPSSLIVNYFLKSHGGAHAFQSLCSFLAAACGVGALLLPRSTLALSAWKWLLLQRTLVFAMLKHISGILIAASIAAPAIPKIGFRETRKWMEQLVRDPVSQYVFYAAILLLWLPSQQRVKDGACWWWSQSGIIPLILGPVLIREVISSWIVLSDVLVLWSVAEEDSSSPVQTVLKVSQAMVNAVMSVLVSPDVWRSADPAQRQAILGKLVSRTSLVLEVAVGFILVLDSILALMGASFLGSSQRPPFRESLTRLISTRLYVHFLWLRKRQIGKLAFQVRGGASQMPFWVLDAMYDPTKAMGLSRPKKENANDMTWIDYALVGLGFDE